MIPSVSSASNVVDHLCAILTQAAPRLRAELSLSVSRKDYHLLLSCAVFKVRTEVSPFRCYPEVRSFKTIQSLLKNFSISFCVSALLRPRLLPACRTPFFRLFLTSASAFASPDARPRNPNRSRGPCLPRKEVIQPHLPIRLPCYDFTPVIGLTFGGCSLRWLTDFGYSQLPWCDGRCVQGPGTYSPRHSDSRLLATPTSCGRVAAHSPN